MGEERLSDAEAEGRVDRSVLACGIGKSGEGVCSSAEADVIIMLTSCGRGEKGANGGKPRAVCGSDVKRKEDCGCGCWGVCCCGCGW